jgi:hypothetical protein
MTEEIKKILALSEEEINKLSIIQIQSLMDKLLDFYSQNKSELLELTNLDKKDIIKENSSIFEEEQQIASFTKNLQRLTDIDEEVDSKYYLLLYIALEKKYKTQGLKN